LGLTFVRKPEKYPSRLGILPGAFNPPTRAHLAIANSGLGIVDQILFILPRQLPHKDFSGVSFDDRLKLLRIALEPEPRFAVASSDGALFIDIARECREAYGPATSLSFLCGRDAAERIVTWDYGSPDVLPAMLEQFDMLVAARHGTYSAPENLRHRIHTLEVGEDCDHIAATEVRQRIQSNKPWQHLVPEAIAAPVKDLYGRSHS
jgi:nicotinate (nicotinamide) nucleotide adenylyltransferase